MPSTPPAGSAPPGTAPTALGVPIEPLLVADDDPRLREVERLIDAGLLLDALAAAERLGALSRLAGPRARCVVGWLLGHLGDSRSAARYHVAEFRRSPDHAVVRYFHAYLVARTRGPLQAWLVLKDFEPSADAPPDARADLFGLKARLLALLGDHREAARMFERCDPDAMGPARFASTRAALLELRDERSSALADLTSALERDPANRILVAQTASVLTQCDRRLEALELLERVEPLLQSAQLTSLRAAIEHELGRLEAESRSLDRLEQLQMKADPECRRDLARRRAENRYLAGDFEEARRQGALSEHPRWRVFATRLQGQSGPPERRQIDLPIVIQEPMGCAPACLAILFRYFGVEVDHVDVADQICYEGTASHSERAWVEARGWLSREFTVDFDVARALLERGLPFLLVTVDIASAHAQVVTGYDATRRTLLIRDPSSPLTREIDAEELFESHRAYGPRGHLVLPPDKASLTDGIQLPEAELHDLAHRLRLALEMHDEALIQLHLGELERRAPEHPLTLWARRSLAIRNGDLYAIRAHAEAISRRFPNDVNARICILDCLNSIGTEQEQREQLEGHLRTRDAPWIYHERLALLVARDARQHAAARRSMRRALAQVPMRGRSVASWAHLEREAGCFELSLCLRRFSTTLEPTDDALAWAYFEEAFVAGQAETALQHLRDRVTRYRERSGEPLSLLFRALEWLDRIPEAFENLERGLVARPDDGGLALFAAQAYERFGETRRARDLLERARPRVSPSHFERAAARLAELRGDLVQALSRHQAVLETEPLSLESHEAVAQLLGELSGPEAAREHLARARSAHPAHCGLLELSIRWLRGHDPRRVLAEIDALLTLQPAHVWARRERALVLSELGEHAQAVAEAEAARDRAPHHASSHRVLAQVLDAAGYRERATTAAMRAVELTPDARGTVTDLLRLATSLPEMHRLVDWAWKQLETGSVSGDGLIEWYECLLGLIPDDELLERVRPLLVARSELWAAHHVVGLQLLRVGAISEATALLRAACARFPFVPRLWLDLADAHRAAHDRAEEVRAAERAFRLNPAWIAGALRAAEALQRNRDIEAAERLILQARRFHPRSAALTLAAAQLSWDCGEVDRALQEARDAVEYEPEERQGWWQFARYADTLQRSAEVVSLARMLAAQRPWNAHIWLRLAEVLRSRSEEQASIEALREALERCPTLFEACDAYAVVLARLGRKEEALAVCDRPTANYFARGALRARQAWVHWEFGDRDQACRAMREVLEEHPDQRWGLQELVDWELERNHHQEAVDLARDLVRLDPLAASGHAMLGAAELAAGRQDDAWRSLSQAARLEPGLVFAGDKRMELALQSSRFTDAEAVITEQGSHVPVHVAAGWELRLACARNDVPVALAALRRILTHPGTPANAILALADPLAAIVVGRLERDLLDLICEEGVHPEAGALWVVALDARNRRPSLRDLGRLERCNEASYFGALRAYFACLGDRGASWIRVSVALLALGRSARKRDDVWGQVGYALTRARAYVLGQLWLADYARRTAAEAWMLHNYRLCALENHQSGAAHRAVEHALSLPADGTLHEHQAFAAFARAANGDIEGARELVAGRSTAGLEGRALWLFESARSLVALHDSDPADRHEPLLELRARFRGTLLALLTPFSWGALHRWLAGGILRQHWSLDFFLRRFALPLLALAVVAWAVMTRPTLGHAVGSCLFVGGGWTLGYLLGRWRA